MESHRLIHMTVLMAMGALFAGLSIAQPIPYVPPEIYQEQRRLQEDRISFCVWEVSPTSDLDRDVANAIASALLVEAEIYVYESTVPLNENFWETVFIHLAEHCDALAGFKIVPEGYPDWLIPSRPYYAAPYVLAVTNPEYESLRDVPRDQVVGSPVLSGADYTFQDYLSALAEDRRWRRFPYTSGAQQLDHLERGIIAGAIMWAPTLFDVTDGDPSSHGVHVASLEPLPNQTDPVGLILRAHNTLLRSQLDDAITALIEDGIIDDLLRQHGLPGGPATAE